MNIPSIKIRAGLWLFLLTGLILAGCAPKQRAADDSFAFGEYYENVSGPDRSTMTPEERFAYDYGSAAVARMRDEGVPLSNVHLVERAKTAIGTPYVRGGTNMSGFDCSGFVQWAYKSVGVSLPRTAREQSVLGTPIDSDEMEAGDIVAFRHPRRGYHTGIYIGDGKFIHSPRRGKNVEITSLDDPYFSSTFLGARRVSISESDAEAAQKLMALYESRSSRLHKTASDATLSPKKSKQTLSSSRSSSKQKAVSSKKRTTVGSKKASSKTSVASSQKYSSKKQVEQKRSSQKKASSTAQKKSASKAKSR